MDDIKMLIQDLTKYFEGNYDCMIGIGDDHISLKTDEEVFVITIEKIPLNEWE